MAPEYTMNVYVAVLCQFMNTHESFTMTCSRSHEFDDPFQGYLRPQGPSAQCFCRDLLLPLNIMAVVAHAILFEYLTPGTRFSENTSYYIVSLKTKA
jgi:hypothetical protein